MLLGLAWWHKVVFDGVDGGLAASRQAQLFEDMADMIARRLLAHGEPFGDLLVGIATGDEGQDFAFALGNGLLRRICRRGRERLLPLFGIEQRGPGGDPANGLEQFGTTHVFVAGSRWPRRAWRRG